MASAADSVLTLRVPGLDDTADCSISRSILLVHLLVSSRLDVTVTCSFYILHMCKVDLVLFRKGPCTSSMAILPIYNLLVVLITFEYL